jgi:hypothetical protein
MSLPLIPFAKLPFKEWIDENTEKKPRLKSVEHEDQVFRIKGVETEQQKRIKERKRGRPRRFKKVVEESSESEEIESVSSGDSSEYDLLDHIRDLLPQEVGQNGVKKLTKQANSLHLGELRVVNKPVSYIGLLSSVGNYAEQLKAEERERRKHHLLRHYEEQVKKYDELQRKRIAETLEQKTNEQLLDQFHRQQRIERNSRKKVEKKLLADQFTNDLKLREKETNQMLFFAENFSKWRTEEMNKTDEMNAQKIKNDLEALRQKQIENEKLQRAKLIENDLNLLKDDEIMTKEIETMMLKSGIIHYNKPKEKLCFLHQEKEMLNNLFAKNKSLLVSQNSVKLKKQMLMNYYKDQQEKNIIITNLDLVLDEENYTEDDFFSLCKEIKKNKLKRNMRINGYFCPFTIDLSEINTNDVTTIKGYHWKEVGIYCFCYEITQHGHFTLLKQLDISNCHVRNNGLITFFYHIKINNIFSLINLNFSNNFLVADHLLKKSFLDLGSLNLLQNVIKLNLSKNELSDAGVEIIIQLVINKYIVNMEEIHLCFNSITNHGFRALLKIFIPLQETCVPHLSRCALENNLIDSKARQEFFPLPAYISV